jgi:hypothetical protein
LGSKLIGNSDGHCHLNTGIFYNIIEGEPESEEELAKALLNQEISIGRDENRIEIFNAQVKKREALIKNMITEGKTAEDYHKATGEWVGNFERVALGKSYEI